MNTLSGLFGMVSEDHFIITLYGAADFNVSIIILTFSGASCSGWTLVPNENKMTPS